MKNNAGFCQILTIRARVSHTTESWEFPAPIQNHRELHRCMSPDWILEDGPQQLPGHLFRSSRGSSTCANLSTKSNKIHWFCAGALSIW